jgi:UTP--glucose-1-phosphate uridylyltransferase
MAVSPARRISGLPTVSLDSAHYGLIKEFERRIRVVPSLVNAEAFSVQGDVTFSHPLAVVGKVSIKAAGTDPTEFPADVQRIDSKDFVL